MTRKSSIYGWLGVLAGILIMVVFQGALGNQQGLLLEPICSDLGITRTLYSTIMSIATLVNLLCSLGFAKFLTKLGIKKMTLIGSFGVILYCLLLLVAGRVHTGSVFILIIAHICFGICFSWAGAMTVSILINNWFAKRASTLISVVSAFSGLTGTVIAPLITRWITADGWQASIIYRGIPVVIVTVLFFFIIRETPGPNDRRVWEEETAEENGSDSESAPAAELSGMTLEEARKSKKFWFTVITVFGLGCVTYPASVVCLPALSVDLGFGAYSGTVMSVLFAANLLATLLRGGFVEKFGCRKALIPVIVVTILAMVLLSFQSIGLGMFYVAAALIGIGYSLVSVAVPFITMEAFGPRDFGRIQSFAFSAMVFGLIVGGSLFNAFYDLTGSYSLIYLISAVVCALLIVTLLISTANRADVKANS